MFKIHVLKLIEISLSNDCKNCDIRVERVNYESKSVKIALNIPSCLEGNIVFYHRAMYGKK